MKMDLKKRNVCKIKTTNHKQITNNFSTALQYGPLLVDKYKQYEINKVYKNGKYEERRRCKEDIKKQNNKMKG